MPNGWYSYVAELFSWALGRRVDEDSCKKCAKREPGRRCAFHQLELVLIPSGRGSLCKPGTWLAGTVRTCDGMCEKHIKRG